MERITDVLTKVVLGDNGYSAPVVGMHTIKALRQGQTPPVKTDALFENPPPVGGLFLQEG
jgi:hypothetical protein